jgi:hypothetical protein
VSKQQPRAKSLVVKVSEKWNQPEIPTRTSAPAFQAASGHRDSNLSAKRNLGLLLARLHGWRKIAFVDDDITFAGSPSMRRLAAQLDQHQVAGMRVREYPDNSVVCHARRHAGLEQDVFVTGAVLGVQCNNLPLPFFPDVYNEDWFFFAREAAARKLASVGEARQTEYDPFASPDRARQEEFGDTLAEGLYTLISNEDPSVPLVEQLRASTTTYWSRFLDVRREVLSETMSLLGALLDRDPEDRRASSALDSLRAALDQLQTITTDLCASFVDAWQDDLCDWQKFSIRVNNVGSTRAAMNFLQMETWTST